MALFQKTVEQKYLKQFDSALINAKYLEFKTHSKYRHSGEYPKQQRGAISGGFPS